MPELPILQPSDVTLMIKPVGALCNLDCTYCYYLPTKSIYDVPEHRMKLATLEAIFAGYLPRAADQVMICWQGGEPTLAGLDFFKRMIEVQEKYRRPTQRISHALQTNGTLLDKEWCDFLRQNGFLVGLSLDGGVGFHNEYRLDNAGHGTHEQVTQGLQLLRDRGVEHNILCVLNDKNVRQPKQLYQYLLGLGEDWLQFIPAIEWEVDPARPGKNRLASYSPPPRAYGKFLCEVFDLWFEKHRDRVSIRIFDAVLNKLVHDQMPFCILDGSCHTQMTIEHDGAVFGCDHFIERRWQLAQIGEPAWRNPMDISGDQRVGVTIHGDGYKPNSELAGRDIFGADDLQQRYTALEVGDRIDAGWIERVERQRTGAFAARKRRLPEKCLSCEWQRLCYGGCPKHRPNGGEVEETTMLCEAYLMFYGHAMERFEWLASYLRRGEQPPPPAPAPQPAVSAAPMTANTDARVGRNDPCPCGSGKKYKKCCGRF